MNKKIFQVTVQPDDGYLFLQFPGNPDIFTAARYRNEIEIMAEDAIFLMRNIPKHEIELDIVTQIPRDFPRTYLQFRTREIINKARSFAHLRSVNPASSADGQ